MLRVINCSCSSAESQTTPAVLGMNILQNPGIFQTLFVIPALVQQLSQADFQISPALQCVPTLIIITPLVLLYQAGEIPLTPLAVIRDSIYSEGRPECPSRVQYSPEIDDSKFTLHTLSDTPGGSQ
jgi:hypothetical protein